MKSIILASSNQGKLSEFNRLLAPLNWQVKPQAELDIPDAIEDGLSFVENAIIKARHACKLSGLSALADDSGIEVDALQGAPGIYSARYAGEPSNSQANNAKLLEALQGIPDAQRTARFRCCIVYMQHAEDPSPLIAEGHWEGYILHAASGANGFGYDPLFYVPDHDCSSAELGRDIKNRISHRAKALHVLLEQLKSYSS